MVGLLSLVTAAGTLLQPLLTRDVLDALQAGNPIGKAVAALVVVLICVAALDGVRSYLLQRTAEGLVLTARRRLAGHLLRLPIAEYDARRTGDLLSRVGADTTLLRAVVTSGLFETVTGALMVVGAATAMILLDPVLFGVTLAGLALGLSGGIFFARRVRALSRDAQARIGEMTSAVERAIGAARTIRASRAEERETATSPPSAREAYEAGAAHSPKLQSMLGPAMVTTVQGSFLLVLGVGGARVANGTDHRRRPRGVRAVRVLPGDAARSGAQRLHPVAGRSRRAGRMEEVLVLPLETDPAAAVAETVPAPLPLSSAKSPSGTPPAPAASCRT